MGRNLYAAAQDTFNVEVDLTRDGDLFIIEAEIRPVLGLKTKAVCDVRAVFADKVFPGRIPVDVLTRKREGDPMLVKTSHDDPEIVF